jgi:hypothetical protein
MQPMKAGIAVVVLSLAVPSTLYAQVDSGALRAALLNISRAVSRQTFTVRVEPPSRVLRQRWERTQSAVDWLTNRVGKTNAADVTPEYLRALQRLAEIAKEASDDQWEDIASELEAKVDHCRRLNIGMGGSVLLKINTRRAGGPVGDWQVVYLLKIYERVKGTAPTNFPRLSTPTEAAVEPGRYWVWARDPSTGKTSEGILVRAAGLKELLVDLPVP